MDQNRHNLLKVKLVEHFMLRVVAYQPGILYSHPDRKLSIISICVIPQRRQKIR